MASGLVALLDDIAGIAKLAAASLDDVGAAAGKAGAKAAGVVVDDTAVTPNYVTGFTPDRELPIIGKIALGSIRNKLLFLLPGALLSAFAPWAVTPLLMLGGAYLCFEATEKIIEALGGEAHGDDEVDPNADPQELEAQKISGAVRTDFILSAEIMAIALADVADRPIFVQAVALAIVGIVITIAVYGVVALIVKMDDIGLHMAKRDGAAMRKIGRGLVQAMPIVMSALSTIGTAAMLWVGGGILVHGLEHFHFTPIPHWIEAAGGGAAAALPAIGGAVHWLIFAIGSAILGAIIGGLVTIVVHAIQQIRR